MKTLEEYKKMLLDAGYTVYIPDVKEKWGGWLYYSDGEVFVYVQVEPLMIISPAIIYDVECNPKLVVFLEGQPIDLTLEHFKQFIEDTKKNTYAVMCEKQFAKIIMKHNYIKHKKVTQE